MKFQKNKKEKENEIMKRIKKIASLLLAMVMVFAMSVTAFATGTDVKSGSEQDGKFKLTINAHEGGDVDGYVYNAFQIFKGDVYENGTTKTLSNIEWGADVDTTGGNFIKLFGKDAKASDVAKEITDASATENEKDTDAAKDFAAKIAQCLKADSTGVASTAIKEGADGKVTRYEISDLNAGYYLVQNSAIPEYEGDVETAESFTRYIMEIVGNATATPKSAVPTSEKKIVENTGEVDVNNAAIGDSVNYVIRGTLPENFADFKTYYYVFTDTLSKGLDAPENTDIKVEIVNGATRTDVSGYFYRDVKKDATTGVSTIKVGIADLKALNLLSEVKDTNLITSATKIEVTYAAVVNQNAEIGKNPNTNDVILDFSNDPNKSGDGAKNPPDKNPPEPTTENPKGQTPKDEVETYVTELSILKVDEQGNPLAGVGFTLTSTDGKKITLVTKEEFVEDENGEFWKLVNGSYTKTAPITKDETDDEGNVVVKNNVDKYESVTKKYKLTKTLATTAEATEGKTVVVGTVDENTGRVTFTGLGEGSYTLSESTTPAGYNTIEDISFRIEFDVTKKTFSSNEPAITLGSNGANTLETTIENKKGSLLPSTGGIGTTIFYVVGGILVIGAGILLVTKRRMKAQ